MYLFPLRSLGLDPIDASGKSPFSTLDRRVLNIGFGAHWVKPNRIVSGPKDLKLHTER